ncbi:SbtR family transcriptional regulator [Amycolatopsis panacis]|uniref:SbtR family transcriptional regulator n=1 Tax=Amycolatopsis panacis TaxID=2340917 RepID=UPI0038991D7D
MHAQARRTPPSQDPLSRCGRPSSPLACQAECLPSAQCQRHAAARSAFDSRGAEASLEEIARCRRGHRNAVLAFPDPRDVGIRPDVTPGELFTIITATAWAGANSPSGRDQSTRLLEIVLDGIATPPQP